MGSYTISVVEDNEATKEAHFEKDGKVFLKAVHDKKIDVVKFHGGEIANLSIEELDAFPKDLIKLFRNNGDDLEVWEKATEKKS